MSSVRACIIRHSRSVAAWSRRPGLGKREGAERESEVSVNLADDAGRPWGNGNQRRRQTWAIIGRYVLLLITIMTAKLGRGYRVRSHGWSACRVYKRCIHLIGIHAASKFLASTCYPGLSLFLLPSSLPSLRPLERLLSVFPSLYLSFPASHRRAAPRRVMPRRSPLALATVFHCCSVLGLLLCTCVRAYVRAYIKFLSAERRF